MYGQEFGPDPLSVLVYDFVITSVYLGYQDDDPPDYKHRITFKVFLLQFNLDKYCFYSGRRKQAWTLLNYYLTIRPFQLPTTQIKNRIDKQTYI